MKLSLPGLGGTTTIGGQGGGSGGTGVEVLLGFDMAVGFLLETNTFAACLENLRSCSPNTLLASKLPVAGLTVSFSFIKGLS